MSEEKEKIYFNVTEIDAERAKYEGKSYPISTLKQIFKASSILGVERVALTVAKVVAFQSWYTAQVKKHFPQMIGKNGLVALDGFVIREDEDPDFDIIFCQINEENGTKRYFGFKLT